LTFAGAFSKDVRSFAADLSAAERAIGDELAEYPRVRQVMLRRAGRSCYLVATPLRVKRLPFAALQYVGDADFLFANRALAQRALMSATGAFGIAVDRRFAKARRVPFAVARPARRLYRPARPGLTPESVDGLFSEMMTLKI